MELTTKTVGNKVRDKNAFRTSKFMTVMIPDDLIKQEF